MLDCWTTLKLCDLVQIIHLSFCFSKKVVIFPMMQNRGDKI